MGYFEIKPGFLSPKVMEKQVGGSLNGLQPSDKQARYFKAQAAYEGNCVIHAVNNAVGMKLITVTDVEARVKKAQLKAGPVPILSKGRKLFSILMVMEAANVAGYNFTKCGGESLRTPEAKFEFLLKREKGRFIALTNVIERNQKSGSHDLEARNVQHWIAVSGDEQLVLDSLARRVGPQPLTEEALKRATREGVVRIYELKKRDK